MLINNDAFHRVADFLKANHFFEPLHGGIFEVISELIGSNKVANPITLKTFFPATLVVAGISIAQYLARLAAEATTIINAVDYGRTVYDLAVRRELIRIAEDMLNGAFEAPIDSAPADQIQHAEQLLYEIAETGRYGGGFETFNPHSTAPLIEPHKRTSPMAGFLALQPASRPRCPNGRSSANRPHHHRRQTRHGEDIFSH